MNPQSAKHAARPSSSPLLKDLVGRNPNIMSPAATLPLLGCATESVAPCSRTGALPCAVSLCRPLSARERSDRPMLPGRFAYLYATSAALRRNDRNIFAIVPLVPGRPAMVIGGSCLDDRHATGRQGVIG